MNINLDKIKKIHFIGIGGSGMCPMAEILKNMGFEITGSDIKESDPIDKLRKSGIHVYIGHKKENIIGTDLIVYTAAVHDDNPEIIESKKLGIATIERSVMLGIITKNYKKSIAISGAHGKTSTTSMVTQILTQSNFDPTAIIGGKLKFINGNSRIGKSNIIICEACEYVDTFLELNPAISIILNIDEDHLDYFKNLENIKKSFNKFGTQTHELIILNGDDSNSIDAIKNINIKKITFGLNKTNDYYATDIKIDNNVKTKFTLVKHGKKICRINLKVPGQHNIYNALAAIAVCEYLSVDLNSILKSLNEFSGVHRRFEILGTPNNITIADDFAHHPTEIKATLNAAKKMGFKRIWAIFQPHTFSRTSLLLDDFAISLSIADKIIISEILAVREKNTYNIYSSDLGNKIENSLCIDTFKEISDFIEKNVHPGDLVLTMGGGNIYECANMILNRLNFIYK